MLTENKVMIINHYDTLASIGIYSQHLKEAAGYNSELYSLTSEDFIKRDANNKLSFPGTYTKGVFPSNFGLYLFNQLYPSFSYRDVSRRIRETKDSGGIIHYSSSMMYPLDNSTDNAVSIHDIIFAKDSGKDAPFFFRKYLISALKKFSRFDHIITPTEFVKNELTDYGVNGDITVIPYGTSDIFYHVEGKREIRKELGLPADKTLVLSVSTTAARKNLSRVEETMERLGNDFKLVRIGKPVGNSITFQSAYGEKLNKIYNACDILFFPTLDEGFGFPTIEAFATGLPVVISDIEVCREVAGNAATYVDPLDVEDMKIGISEALANKDTFSARGLQRSQVFSMEKFRKSLRSFYERVG